MEWNSSKLAVTKSQSQYKWNSMGLVALESPMDNPRRMSHHHCSVPLYWWPDLLANKYWIPGFSKWGAGESKIVIYWAICCREAGKIQKRNKSQIRFLHLLYHEDRPNHVYWPKSCRCTFFSVSLRPSLRVLVLGGILCWGYKNLRMATSLACH